MSSVLFPFYFFLDVHKFCKKNRSKLRFLEFCYYLERNSVLISLFNWFQGIVLYLVVLYRFIREYYVTQPNVVRKKLFCFFLYEGDGVMISKRVGIFINFFTVGAYATLL